MGMAYQTFQQEYMQIPPVTRAYTTACVLTTLAVVSLNIIISQEELFQQCLHMPMLIFNLFQNEFQHISF